VRTRPIGALAALIAVVALVALAGPAETRVPGAAHGTERGTLTPLVLDRIQAAVATDPAPAASFESSRSARAIVIVDPGALVAPTRAPVLDLPALRVTAVAKAVPKRTPVARSTSTVGGSGWQSAGYSWYGPGLYGNGTACGQTLTRSLVGVAHRSLPCGTRVTFRNPANGRTITVRVVDRGPYVSGRLWDLTGATCRAIDACYTGRIQWRLP
jgi:rare lipoprotein A (peptidoglycan hydrolase)